MWKECHTRGDPCFAENYEDPSAQLFSIGSGKGSLQFADFGINKLATSNRKCSTPLAFARQTSISALGLRKVVNEASRVPNHLRNQLKPIQIAVSKAESRVATASDRVLGYFLSQLQDHTATDGFTGSGGMKVALDSDEQASADSNGDSAPKRYFHLRYSTLFADKTPLEMGVIIQEFDAGTEREIGGTQRVHRIGLQSPARVENGNTRYQAVIRSIGVVN